jgi:outer membrane protein TolC/preprotein translocase subunit SecF
MLLLPLRVASVAAITIPVCIAITLGVLNALHVQLETVSLAGLIVVLGMIVDNAIVVIDDHVDKLDRGMDPWTAAWKSARELTVPVLTATIAIILSYVPMPMFLTGTPKDVLGSLPTTVGVALVVSLLVALFLVPVMNSRFIRRGLHRDADRRSMLDRIQTRFDGLLERVFQRPRITLAVAGATVVIALAILAGLPRQMFSKVDRNQFAVEVYLPNGRSLQQTDAVMRRLERELRADKRVVNVTAFVGQSSPRFHTVYAPQWPARNFGQLVVNTVDEKATEAVLRENERRLQGAFPEAWVRWKQLALQLGNAVEVRLTGNDIPTLKRTAAQIEAYARTIPGTTWVRNDYEDALQTIDVVPDPDATARLGVPPAILQASLALGSQGFNVGTIWEGDYPVRVLVMDPPGQLAGVEGLRQQYVSSVFAGASVPLEQVAAVAPAWHEGAIVRRNGERTLTVNIDVAMGVLGSTVQKQVEGFVEKLPLDGVQVSWGGEVEMTQDIFPPFERSMLVSMGLIFLVLLFQFQRFGKVIVVMLGMPLSLFGACLGLWLLGYPFGMTSFVGLIGLFGLVVRNGVILVTYAEQLQRDQGLSAKEAALAAGKRRMRPIYLTSMAAAIGVLPMVIGRSTLWGPLGTVTCFGVLFAMVLTLFVLPIAYWLIEEPHHLRRSRPAPAVVAGLVALLALLPSGARGQERPLTLEEARALTLRNNAAVNEAALEVDAARETRRAAFTKYFPQVSASAVELAARDPLVEFQIPGGDLPVYDGNPANLNGANQFAYFPGGSIAVAQRAFLPVVTAMQPVFTGGRVVNGNRLAGVGVEVARDRSDMALRDALAQTEEKYWRLVALRQKLHTLDAYEQLLAALDRQVSDALVAGLVTSNDQLKVRLKRSEAAVDRQRLDSGLRLAARDLRRHIGLPSGDSISLADPLPPPGDPAALREGTPASPEGRPELRLLSSAVRAEELQTALKRGEMLPTIAVGASLFRLDVRGMPAANHALAFGMVSVPVSGIWEAAHAAASQQRRVDSARRRLSDTRELLALEIEKSWSDLQIAWQSVQVADRSVEQAEVNVREVSDRYSAGLVPFSDLLEAQVLRQQALDRRTDARVDFWLRRSAYLRSIGGEEGG